MAADHPNGLTTSFVFPSAFSVDSVGHEQEPYAVEKVKRIVADLPPGVVGDALSAPTCSLTTVTDLSEALTQCPSSTRVGKLALLAPGGAETGLTIFNATPERGYPAEFAVFLPSLNHAELLYASVVGSGAATRIRVISAPQDSVVQDNGVSLTFFGDPALLDGTPLTPVSFFTNPSDCAALGFTSRLYVDSWQHPGRVEPDGQPDLSDPNWKGASSTSPPVTGCEALQFHPTLSFAPEEAHSQADEPSGYSSTLQAPQNEDPNGLATPPLKRTVVTLPPGVSISPSAANGLAGCQAGPEGIGLEREAEASQPGHCPDASKIGQVEASTPVLGEPLKGSVYVAQPTCGGASQPACSEEAAERGGVFAIYLELASQNSGVYVKVPGRIEVGGNEHRNDLAPGQVRTTFAETPQDPVSELKLKFNGGPRAPLANPQSCGSFTSAAELEPWSHQPAPGEAQGTPNVTQHPSFTIAGCEDKFAPAFTAGTTNPQAGGFSPFTLTFSRQDREQDLSGVSVSLPAGLLGKIAGIPQCPEAQAAAGSCASASRIGSATAAAGSGSHPFWQSGSVYLTGPYKGAPFGLSVVVPAVAGPFNLGNIVVRAAITVDPHTAQITVVSDPLPQSVDGVPLRVKTVNVTVDRPAFMFNPTNCSALTVNGTLSSVQGVQVPVSNHFQAANCASLPFKPALSASTGGKASKAGGASLDVKVSSGVGQANIGKIKVDLPKQLPSRLTTLQKACLASVFDVNPANCPSASDVGMASASTPVLANPLVGPAYLVSHGGEAFPDLEIVLQGEGVKVILVGSTQIKKGITSSTFKAIPDAPVSSFELKLPTGKYSILGANVPQSARYSLCGQSLSMPTAITGQNGAVIKQTTRIAVTGCVKHKARKAKKAKTKRRGKTKPGDRKTSGGKK
ncbi:MAG TPA: hypothetical protein VGG98_07825 [Solirubrobacteraceae bacterium]